MLLFDDPRFDLHDPGPGHAERVERLPAIRAALADQPWPRRAARPALREELLAVHGAGHVDRVLSCAGKHARLDPDTVTSPGSVVAALCAAGAALEAADALLQGERSFVLCRPPGHHATPRRAMGFCLFNNAALAAGRLSGRGGDGPGRRVVVFDPDVHHGNGTQDIFWRRGDVLYLSLHRGDHGFYPGTGRAEERGEGPGLGATINEPLPAGADDAAWAAALARAWPRVEAFGPELCVISAGFDGLEGDPLGGMRLSVEGMVALWRPFVERLPTLAVLEGGYGLDPLARGVAATARLLAAS